MSKNTDYQLTKIQELKQKFQNLRISTAGKDGAKVAPRAVSRGCTDLRYSRGYQVAARRMLEQRNINAGKVCGAWL